MVRCPRVLLLDVRPADAELLRIDLGRLGLGGAVECAVSRDEVIRTLHDSSDWTSSKSAS
jgi:hypothetical protein